MDSRIRWVDTFRAVMIFCIAFGHAIPGGILNRYVFFHVAAFFFVSGYLFDGKRFDSFSEFVHRKFKSLMIPYYSFSVLSIAIFVVLGQLAAELIAVSIKSTDILPNIFGMLYANGATGYMKWNLPLWFIPCLFVTILTMYIINRYLLRYEENKRELWGRLVLLIVALLVFNFINYNYFDFRMLPFGFENTVYLLPFVLAGYGFRMAETDLARLPVKTVIIIGIIFVMTGCVVSWPVNTHIDYVKLAYGNLPIFYVSSFMVIVGCVLLCRAASSNRILLYVGKNTMQVLLMHKFPIVFLQVFLVEKLTESISGIFISFVIALTAVAASLLAGRIIKKICPFVIGSSK